MPKGKRLVIDASVGASAASSPVPGACAEVCRESLLAVGQIHRIVFSKEGWDEWNRHESRFAGQWRRQMVARRKVLFLAEGAGNEGFREALSQVALPQKARRALEKDAHLAEAADATDRIIISRDEKVRSHFRSVCSEIPLLKEILWANPEIEVEEVVKWLRTGARMERFRKLGSDRDPDGGT